MVRQKIAGEISKYGEGFFKGVAIDPVIFGYDQGQLKILLVLHGNTSLYALPGGYIGEKEDLDAAAKRVLRARTSLTDIYLEQFYVFGNYNRNDTETIKKIMVGQGIDPVADHWVLGRFISVGYYALVNFTEAIPTPDAVSDSCDWHDLSQLPPLILDHALIVRKALKELQLNLDRKLIAFNLMPETFTIPDLHNLYETILGEKIVPSNFQRKILSLDILERLDKKRTGGAHKAPYLYRFKQSKRLDE